MASRPLMITGGVLLALAVLLPMVLFATADDGWDGVFAFLFMGMFAFPAGIVGLILLIVGATRGRGQQQQQQVVIMTAPGPGAPVVRTGIPCPSCRSPRAVGARFCTNCGARA